MRYSPSSVSPRTFGLAFAVVLSPAFFQTAYSRERGDTYLLQLELELAGQSQIVGFRPDTRSYDVSTIEGTAFLRTQARKPDSTVAYQWLVGGTSIEAGVIGVGSTCTMKLVLNRTRAQAVDGNLEPATKSFSSEHSNSVTAGSPPWTRCSGRSESPCTGSIAPNGLPLPPRRSPHF